jgi:hypothetical protein
MSYYSNQRRFKAYVICNFRERSRIHPPTYPLMSTNPHICQNQRAQDTGLFVIDVGNVKTTEYDDRQRTQTAGRSCLETQESHQIIVSFLGMHG